MTQNIGTLEKPRRRFHRTDAWRGYPVPALAVAGASDTGSAGDSPCPTASVRKELARVRRECLVPAGVCSRVAYGSSSNVFCGKIWLTVARKDFAKAAPLVQEWLDAHRLDTLYVHDANQDQYFKEAIA